MHYKIAYLQLNRVRQFKFAKFKTVLKKELSKGIQESNKAELIEQVKELSTSGKTHRQITDELGYY